MNEPVTYLHTVSSYWTRLGAKTLYRMQHALDDVKNEAYTFQKLTLDVLGFYKDSYAICMKAAGGTPGAAPTAGPMPTVQLTARSKQDTATGKVAMNLPTATVVTCSDLLYVPTGGTTAPKIDKSNVAVSVTAAGELEVDVNGLAAGAVVGSS